MKNRLLVSILFLLLVFSKIYAQNDTVIVKISQEPIENSDFQYQQKYKYLDINLKEEKNLLKVGVAPIEVLSIGRFKDNNWTIDLNTNYEVKFDSAYSLILGFNPKIVGDAGFEKLYLKLYIESRYYFSKVKEIKNGVSADNSNGKYIGFHLAPLSVFENRDNVFTPSITRELIQAHVGVQRRLGKYSYIDAYGYLGYYNDESLKIGFSIYFGFANGW